MQVTDGSLVPVGYEQLTSLAAATGLTGVATARVCLIQAEVSTVRWRDDGTNPTASVGMRLIAGNGPDVYNGDWKTIKFIQESAGAKVNVAYYR